MPLYEYECQHCGVMVELLRSFNQRTPDCEECKKPMKKLISLTSFSLQGDGWAKDNYGLKK